MPDSTVSIWAGGWIVIGILSLIGMSADIHRGKDEDAYGVWFGVMIVGGAWPLIVGLLLVWFGLLVPLHALVGVFVPKPAPPDPPELIAARNELDAEFPDDV